MLTLGSRSISRQALLGGVCALWLFVGAPAHAEGASLEEEAALALFKEGRSAFGAGDYERALQFFEDAGDVLDNVYVRFYVARTHAALGRCAEALPSLEELAGRLPDDAEAPRKEDVKRCLLHEARRLVKAVNCAEALPVLTRLKGLLTGVNEEWRGDMIPWCEARITDFVTDTTLRKTAYKLYLAAKGAETAGDAAKAERFYRKALGLVEEPVLRERLAWLQVETGGCDVVRATLNDNRNPSEKRGSHLLVACAQYGPDDGLRGPQLRSYLQQVVAGLRALEGGERQAAAELLGALASAGQSAAVVALYADVLHDLERCGDYVHVVSGADAETRALITQADMRLARCEAGHRASSPVPGGPDGSLHLSADEASEGRVMEWSLIGIGAAALVGSGAVAMVRQGTVGELADAETAWNAGASPAARAAGLNAVSSLQDEAALQGTVVVSLGAVGLGAVLTGSALLLLRGAEQGDSPSETTRVGPFFSRHMVGIQGRF